jgi:hypothetical protein
MLRRLKVFAKNNLSKEESVKQALKEVIENGESVIRAAVNRVVA